MGSTEQQAVIPHEQAFVPFYNGEILGVRLLDDYLAAGINSMCSLIGVVPQAQVRRIRRDKALSSHLVLVLIETPTRGAQRMDFLIVEAIPSWLMGLEISMIAPEKRPLILALQFDAAHVLYRHFFKIKTEPTLPPEAEQPKAPPRSAQQMMHEAIDAIYQEHGERFAAIESRQAVFDERQVVFGEMQEALGEHLVEIKDRVIRLEGREPRGSAPFSQGEAPGQAAPAKQLLSPERIGQVVAMARLLGSQTGQPTRAIYTELAEVFGLEDFTEIPDADWERIEEWFWRRGVA